MGGKGRGNLIEKMRGGVGIAGGEWEGVRVFSPGEGVARGNAGRKYSSGDTLSLLECAAGAKLV